MNTELGMVLRAMMFSIALAYAGHELGAGLAAMKFTVETNGTKISDSNFTSGAVPSVSITEESPLVDRP